MGGLRYCLAPDSGLSAGLTQAALAVALMVDRKTIGNAETGRHEPLPLLIREWARVTTVDREWLVTGRVTRRPGLRVAG